MRRQLTAIELDWAENLRLLWLAKSKELGIKQADVAKSMGIARATVCQYLNGHIALNTDKKLQFAKILGVEVTAIDARFGFQDTMVIPSGDVPLISWVMAGDLCESPNMYIKEDDKSPWRWIPCPTAHSSNSYALKVEGDSMTANNGGESYPAGSIVFVDRSREAVPGNVVVAKNGVGYTLKKLVHDGASRYLKPINPQYPIIEFTKDMCICGVVIGMFIESFPSQ